MPEILLQVQHGDPSDLWRSLQAEEPSDRDLVLEYRQSRPPPGTFGFIVASIAASVTTLAAVIKLGCVVHRWMAGKEKTVVEFEDKASGTKLKITRDMSEKEVEHVCTDFFAAAQRHRRDDPPSLPPT